MDLNQMHRKYCPSKCFSNFWKSSDYQAAGAVLKETGQAAVLRKDGANKGRPSVTDVHPLVALAFLRWADQDVFYKRIAKLLS